MVRRHGQGQAQARHWCFTINDNPDWEVRNDWAESGIRGIVYQTEVAPETGNVHIQGYVEFTSARRMNSVKDILQSRTVHVEPRHGPRKDAYDYCQKEESRAPGTEPTIIGKFPSAWLKSKFDDICDAIVKGATLPKVAETHPALFARHKRSFQDLRFEVLNKRLKRDERLITVHTYYGPSGTGKSRRATWEAKEWLNDNGREHEVPYRKNPGTKWWCDYDGEACVILDDVSHSDIQPLRMFLRVLDRYPLQVETKGGNCYAGWLHVWITSNEAPMAWYPNDKYEPGTPLYRRLEQANGSRVEHMTTRWYPPIEPVLATYEELPPTPIPDVEPALNYLDPMIFQPIPRPNLVRQETPYDIREVIQNMKTGMIEAMETVNDNEDYEEW